MKKFFILLTLFFCDTTLHAGSKEDVAYSIEASFVSTAPIRIIWSVLTDYDHIAEFVPTIIESKFTAPDLLYQKVKGRWWFIKKTVHLNLRLKETLYNSIEFETVSSSDSFKIYRGKWELKAGDVVSVSYVLLVKPNFFVPQKMISGVLARETKIYMDSVQAEINLRWDALKQAERNLILLEK